MRQIANKVDGVDNLAATKWNAQNNERQNIVTSAGLTLDSEAGPDTDLNMLSKAVSGYANAANVYADSGGVNSYVLSLATLMEPPHKYHANMAVLFEVGNTNTGASIVNVAGLGNKNVTYPDGTALVGGDLIAGQFVTLVYDLGNNRFMLVPDTMPKGKSVSGSANGLVVKRATAATIDIDADEIVVTDAAGLTAIKLSGVNLSVDITASGANGLDTGVEAASTNYYLFVIHQEKDTITSGLISLSKTAPTLPGNTRQFALVGEFFNDASSDITYVNQLDGQFLRDGVVAAKDPAGASITGSLTNLVDLDLGDVTIGDVFLIEGIVTATKGGTTGTTGMFTSKKSGTATIASYFDGPGGEFQVGVGANEIWVFSHSTEITVTASGTLVMQVEAASAGSTSAMAAGDAQARVRFIKKA